MVTYGHQVKDKHDSIISQIEHASTLSVTLGSPGATIVDLFPIRTWPNSLDALQNIILD